MSKVAASSHPFVFPCVSMKLVLEEPHPRYPFVSTGVYSRYPFVLIGVPYAEPNGRPSKLISSSASNQNINLSNQG